METILIANRGEIAVRVARTCRDLGLTAVAVHSAADAGALHVRTADRAVALAGNTAAETYLDAEAILAAAVESGADAIHPGYGFLSENAGFAQAVLDAGLTWIGPPPEAIRAMGDKVTARRTAAAAGVLGVPGTPGPIADAAEAVAFAEEHGWPLVLKASAGGGGRGMRVVTGAEEAERALAAAQREATAAFGDGSIYVERYLESPRHIEVQVIADTGGGCVALGDRDCSVQRRHQKLVEEAPAPAIEPAVHEAMAAAAVAVARAVDYVGVGTVELLYEGGEFHFLEMNTRLQVEHTVTEVVFGLDLVAEQLRIAAGEPLGYDARALRPRGHAIECRINAEDPAGGRFLPSAGVVSAITAPQGPGLRFDSGYEPGDEVSDLYDNLVAKLVAWAPTRAAARRRAQRALAELRLEGVASNVAALSAVLTEESFARAEHSTRWIELHSDLLPAALAMPAPAPVEEPAGVTVNGRTYYLAGVGERPLAATPSARAPASVAPRPGRRREATAARSAPVATSRQEPGLILAPMQGRVLDVVVGAGDTVVEGQALCVLEAMKMENEIVADIAGTVVEISVEPGDGVGPGEPLVRIEQS
jgi:acetyl-CoA/propionyl-CoA carboxylase biotin carboxyl carrier protein